MDDSALERIARRLAGIGGVAAVVLGGSRARGTHRPDSDFDIGLYYRGDLDVAALQRLTDEVADEPAAVTRPGEWGPWVDGGGWLRIGGHRVDWIYRDLERVHEVARDTGEGRYGVHFQVGHPLGFYSHAYAGEVALCRVLADPTGEVGALREQLRQYPPALGEALVRGLWEADFAARIAAYGAAGGDPAYVAAALFRAVGVACHALHGHDGRWLINEKGMVAATGRLASAPAGFAARAGELLGALGTTPDGLAGSLRRATDLIADVHAAVGAPAPPVD